MIALRPPDPARLADELMRRLIVDDDIAGVASAFAEAKLRPDELWASALIRGWTDVLTILGFYQHRIAREGYVDTAIEAISGHLLAAGIGADRGRIASAAVGGVAAAPAFVRHDAGTVAIADFIVTVRGRRGVPEDIAVPVGAQLRHHGAEAAAITLFEADAPHLLRAGWNRLPLVVTAAPTMPTIVAGAAGFLASLPGPLPRAGDRLLIADTASASDWCLAQVTQVTADRTTGTAELLIDQPPGFTAADPLVAVCDPPAQSFGWNAPDFASLPVRERIAWVRGRENAYPGGVRVRGADGWRGLSDGLPADAPTAVALAPDGTLYLATAQDLHMRRAGEPWRALPRGAATRAIGTLTVAADGLVMIGGLQGSVWTSADPTRGFDPHPGGYVLDERRDTRGKPIPAMLAGGAARRLWQADGIVTGIVAQTDAGLFLHERGRFWLPLSARAANRHDHHMTPLTDHLAGRRLADALPSSRMDHALLALGDTVERVVLGPPLRPAAAEAGKVAAEPDPRAAPRGWRRIASAFERDLARLGRHEPVDAWRFAAPVRAIAALDDGDARMPCLRFLAATADAVYLADADGGITPAVAGLPGGGIDRFIVAGEGAARVVYALTDVGMFRFDPVDVHWRQEVAAAVPGTLRGAASGAMVAVAEPLVLPDEFPDFDLPAEPVLDLLLAASAVAPGDRIVLAAPDAPPVAAIVTETEPVALAGFGLKAKGVRVRFAPTGGGYHGRMFNRRTLLVHVAARTLALAAPARLAADGMGDERRLLLDGDRRDVAVPRAAERVNPRQGGVAGAMRMPLPVPGVSAALTTPPLPPAALAPVLTGHRAPRVAVGGRPARILPRPLGGIAPLEAPGIATLLAGEAISAIQSFGDALLVLVDGVGLCRADPVSDVVERADAGLGAPIGPAAQLVAGGAGAGARAFLLDDGALFAAGSSLAWHPVADSPRGITQLALLPSGRLIVVAAGGISALAEGRWSSITAVPERIAAIAAAGADDWIALREGMPMIWSAMAWQPWGRGKPITGAATLAFAGDVAYVGSPAGVIAVPRDAPFRPLPDTAGATVIAAADSTVAIARPGRDVLVSHDAGRTWTNTPLGLANDVRCIALAGEHAWVGLGRSVLASREDGTLAATTPLAVKARLDPAQGAALDAGLLQPLVKAMPPDAGITFAPGARVTVVEPERLWLAGDASGAELVIARSPLGLLVLTPDPTLRSVARMHDGGRHFVLTLADESTTVQATSRGALLVLPAPVDAAESVTVAAVMSAAFDPDRDATTLTLDAWPDAVLDPASAWCSANVIGGVEGETIAGEVLGDGDGGAMLQRFTLRRAPLAFSAGPDGPAATLRVLVDGADWQPVGSLAGAGPGDRVYSLRVDPAGKAQVEFGDGRTGARLPTGRRNVVATYRIAATSTTAIGPGITTLMTGLGSIATIRPVLRAPARPPRDVAHASTPGQRIAELTAARLVTAADYARQARALPGVRDAHVDVVRRQGGRVLVVSVFAPAARSLPALLARIGARLTAAQAVPAPAFQVLACAVRPLVLSLRLWLEEGADRDAVAGAVRAAMVARLGASGARIALTRTRGEVEECVQAIPGVAGLVVRAFHRVDAPAACEDRIVASPARSQADAVLPAEVLVLPGSEAIRLTFASAAP